jgi:hypothetical protein
MGAIDFTNIIGVAGGAVGAGLIDKVIPASIDAKIASIGKIAIGVLLPNMVKSGKMKNVMSGVGAGFIAVGTTDLLRGMGVLQGTNEDALSISLNGDQDYLGADVLAGDDLNVVNGDDLSVVNADVLGGDDDEFAN